MRVVLGKRFQEILATPLEFPFFGDSSPLVSVVSKLPFISIYKPWNGHLEGVPQPQQEGTYDHHGY